ncbi:TPA: helix-turn-helix transcriptional regulator [Pseudomonas aeruginosa]|uniref:Antitoxin HipB n=1 Tax=Pseudomonas aeruginosa TaxID=287 RepID=A0A5E5QZ06_PSEAI|nr:helix-turn-helix transcriptional regulator [Pseudomonas aeruginosa]MBG5706182.1 helix-turn-helix transcriptional regulator [Pseudomonas aeruginosa]VVH80473.1 antitoxin HipB [Pseudomonas aeruginosa]HBN8046707.1 helix-turn-helix transcriptional regulator [Pseudomonas aeruginosa]HCF2408820.1 helix-turn-helix transcriptional regulator [Pseudomonas aeruginosa]HCK0515632.1 helix-turn-helix transcriptional regulator [Pseudomonas aeruginosa]
MTQDTIKALGKRLKHLRESIKWTQAQLAEKLGCEPITISRYERGQSAMGIDTLGEIANALELPIAAFFIKTSEPTATPTEPSRDELRHYLCDLIYEVNDRESLKEIATLANGVITRRRKQRTR